MKYIGLLSLFILTMSCKKELSKNSDKEEPIDYLEVIKDGYELSSNGENSKAVLVLFGGYPEVPQDVKEQFNILPIAKENQVAVLIMNYNQKLYLEERSAKLQTEATLLQMKFQQVQEQMQLVNVELEKYTEKEPEKGEDLQTE